MADPAMPTQGELLQLFLQSQQQTQQLISTMAQQMQIQQQEIMKHQQQHEQQLQQLPQSQQQTQAAKVPFNKTTFSGSQPDALEAWLFKLEQQTEGQPDKQKIKAAVMLLEGAALQWRMKYDAPEDESWQGFKHALGRRFGRLFTAEHARAALDRLQQQQGSVRAYTAEYERLAAHVEQTAADKIYRYQKGLRQRVREAVAVQRPVSFDEAVAIANSFEEAITPPSSTAAANNYNNNSSANRQDGGGCGRGSQR